MDKLAAPPVPLTRHIRELPAAARRLIRASRRREVVAVEPEAPPALKLTAEELAERRACADRFQRTIIDGE